MTRPGKSVRQIVFNVDARWDSIQIEHDLYLSSGAPSPYGSKSCLLSCTVITSKLFEIISSYVESLGNSLSGDIFGCLETVS